MHLIPRTAGRVLRAASGLVPIALLSACSGGPGDVFSDTENSFLLTVESVSCEQAPGTACEDIDVKAIPISSRPEVRPVWTELPATAGSMAIDHLYRNKQDDGSWIFTVGMKKTLAPGSYSGVIEVTLGTGILTEYRPARLAYKLTVGDLKGQQPTLKALAGAGDWRGFGANAAHTGLVGATLDTSRFTRRWSLSFQDSPSAGGLAAANGLVYMQRSDQVTGGDGKPQSVAAMLAFNESDGSARWRYQGPALASLSGPGVDGQRLVAQQDNKHLLGFDALTGALLFDTVQPDSGGALVSRYWAPTVSAGNAYTGKDNDVVAAETAAGSTRWSASLGLGTTSRVTNWTPATNDSTVFALGNGQLNAYNVADGAKLFDVAVPGPTANGLDRTALHVAPVIADAGQVILLSQRDPNGESMDNTLSLVDVNTRAVRWSVKGRFTTHPVVGGGFVYVGNNTTLQLEARKISDGTVAWSWPLADGAERWFRTDLVLTQNLLFAATDRKTYAIDLATHKAVWRFPMSGTLALSGNGVLYILNQDAATRWLTAINVQ